MVNKKRLLFFVIGIIAATMLACNMPLFIAGSDSSQGSESTAAAQTVEAQLTQMANTPVVTQAIPTATNTPEPTNTTPPTATPTKTATPTATSKPIPCNSAQFIRDMTVADGSQFAPGTTFLKVWRLKNIGSCTWNKSYTVTFDGGDKLGGSTFDMPENVSPGESIDVAIEMTAPNTKGSYKGFWLLRDDDGNKFGLGGSAEYPFWVAIKVVTKASGYSYEFAPNICNATWKNDSGTIYCEGTSEAFKSYVNYTTSFQMESGKVENEPALIVNAAKDDRIRGIYPAYKVQDGDHFVSQIGCLYDNESCKVKVVLSYRIEGSDTKNILGEWTEKYDEATTMIDIDLSSLAGEKIVFTLDVSSLSTSDHNEMFWFVPSIRN